MKKTVHNTFFYEYAGLTSPGEFGAVKEIRNLVGMIVLGIFLLIYLLSRFKTSPSEPETQQIGDCRKSTIEVDLREILGPFVACALLFVVLGAVIYPIRDLLFFLFPLDIFLDHGRQLGSGRTYVIPLFLSLSAFLLFMRAPYPRASQKSRIALFLVLLLPGTFARFFPTYNMLYLISFIIAAFANVMLPHFARLFLKDPDFTAARVQWTLAMFFLLYAMAANFMLLMKVPLSDLVSGRVVLMTQGPIKSLFIARDVANFFVRVNSALAKFAPPNERVAFFSNRYLNYVPLVYDRRDVFAGQNLVIGLGKLSSYDALLSQDGVGSASRFDQKKIIYNWREMAQRRLFGTRIIVMSLYNPETTKGALPNSSDPLKEYIRQHFSIVDVIEPVNSDRIPEHNTKFALDRESLC